jgi:hypothetical protein
MLVGKVGEGSDRVLSDGRISEFVWIDRMTYAELQTT